MMLGLRRASEMVYSIDNGCSFSVPIYNAACRVLLYPYSEDWDTYKQGNQIKRSSLKTLRGDLDSISKKEKEKQCKQYKEKYDPE